MKQSKEIADEIRVFLKTNRDIKYISVRDMLDIVNELTTLKKVNLAVKILRFERVIELVSVEVYEIASVLYKNNYYKERGNNENSKKH